MSRHETKMTQKRVSVFTTALAAGALMLATAGLAVWPAGSASAQSANADIAFDTEDMDFILKQIKFAERHAAGENLLDILPNASIPWGLRTVDGSFNNLIPGQEAFGSADQIFPVLTERVFPDAEAGTSYNSAVDVIDSTPRLISHMTVNQSVGNPAAVSAAAAEGGVNIGPDITGVDQLFIPNTAVDEGLSAPINAFTTFFGQFFDHGLDLVNKGGNGVIMIPLQADDPLFVAGSPTNFMVMPRATRGVGEDGVLGTADDTFVNATTPHVDQQQTYASHASSQIILRHYELRPCLLRPATGCLQNTGRMLNGFGNDGILDTTDDGGMATWDTAQLQALQKFGIILDDLDGNNVPMIASDVYGNFIPGPARGLPQLVTQLSPLLMVEGNIAAPVDATQALRVNQSFFLDVAHSAAPNGAPDVDSVLNPRTDLLSGQVTRGIRMSADPGFYDDELLGVHFVCGDGRCNENIALTTIHTIFHHEHNRLTNVAKRVLLDAGDLATLNEWLDTPLAAFPAWGGLPFSVSDASMANQATAEAAIDALGLDWNGGRIFQAARFGTEMQYNRIVFDEFSPILAGLKDVFEGFLTDVDPTITAEFSQSVYRFGHSMLTETVDRFDADFATITDTHTLDPSQLGLFEAFLNPLALYNAGEDGVGVLSPEVATGAVVRGLTRTVANEIDEFTTGALQNNLVGLPLDLGAINIARGRDVGNPPLNAARKMFFELTQDTRLTPYLHWADYLDNLRHEASLVNFIAAYGTHPSITVDPTFAGRRAAACAIVGALTADPAAYCAGEGFGFPVAGSPADAHDFMFSNGAWASVAGETITGLEKVDFWNGGLAEERMPFGGYLGSTHNYVFETQMESLQNGDRFYYVGRTANIHFFGELESNSFTTLAMRSTDLGDVGGGALSLNIFAVPNHILEIDQSQQFDAAGDGTTADPTGESALVPLVIRDAVTLTTNIDVPDSTRVIQYTGGDHVTINGTLGHDTIIGGIGDDSLYGGEGNDRIEGGDGADLIEGGPGDDIITDLSGPDVIEGGDGNDAINSGNEEDVIFGDAGNDFIVNPSEFGEIFGGLGDDYIFDGDHLGHIRGGAGDDWMENLGGGEDLFQGDNGAAPEAGEPLIKGNDVFISHGGNNDADMENGDDIIVDGPGIDRAEGQLGFDWMSFQNDRFGVNVNLGLTVFDRPVLPPSNDTVANRVDRVEGLSGSPFADILKGSARDLGAEDPGNELSEAGIALITGLSDLVPLDQREALGLDFLTGEDLGIGWRGSEIITPGDGGDLVFGLGGDDIIDGDAMLTVMIETPDPALRGGALGLSLHEAQALATSAASQAAADAAAAVAFVQAAIDAQAAVDAANTAATAAIAAANAATAANTSNLTITTELGVVISNDTTAPAKHAAWQTFLNTCSAIVNDLGLQLQTTTADTAAEAIAAQTAALAAQVAAQVANLNATAAASATAAVTAAADLVTAQNDFDTLPNGNILVPSMQNIMEAVFAGLINPGELSISRVIADEDPTDEHVDTAAYTGNLADYTVDSTRPDGFLSILDNRPLPLPVPGLPVLPGNDGFDLVRNIERLAFADQTVEIPAGTAGSAGLINNLAVGLPTISGPSVLGGTLTASIASVTDADNTSSGSAVVSPVSWTWQSELEPGSGVFTEIIQINTAGDEVVVQGENLVLTDAEVGLQVRVMAIFQDELLVFEVTTSLDQAVGAAVADTTPPTITAPADGSVSTFVVPIGLSIGTATAADPESGITSIVSDAPALFPEGTTTVTWTATNGAGLTAIDTQIVTVTVLVDSTPPTITAPADVSVTVPAAPVPVSIGVATAADPETGIVSVVSDAPALFPAGATTVTWTATNGVGLTAIATQTVTVTVTPPVDTTPPTITAPADVSVTVPAAPVAVVIGIATAADPESGIASIVSDAPALFPAGPTTVTWTATNGAGLTAIATQTVTVTVVPGGEVPTDTFLDFGGNASNDHVDIADSNALDLTGGSFTISAWIRPTNFGQAGQGRIVDHGGGSSGAGGWTLQLMDRAAFVNQGLMVQIEGGGPFVSNPNVITLGAWQHVAVTLDAGTLTFYVNGVASGVVTGVVTPAPRAGGVRLGLRDVDNARDYAGDMDEIRIWNVARTAGEIAANMNSELIGSEAGLVAYYKLNEGAGQIAADSTVNGHTGELGTGPGVDAGDPTWRP